ncbi:VOC family protein [Nitriliruptor alkaliphilus]|uniref:VOC family protein n=1 Tax=Nitriliruptor alkaliphilus TaxID=427918 RepID=UPI000698163F|nr:extradiol dioxygenase [Nitriliruptor alkaliphilus]
MISGTHAILYSNDAEVDRQFLLELLGTPHVDAGDGWLILKLPPAEVAVHPTEGAPKQELYLMVDDADAFVRDLGERGVDVVAPVSDQGWGRVLTFRLPSGAPLSAYEPRHDTAHSLPD